MTELDNLSSVMIAICDEKETEGGISILAAKRYSINRLREFGYSDAAIEKLLAIKL